LAALESEFRRSTSELTREIQNAVAELRSAAQPRARQLAGEPQTPAWPLEDVTRLHSQLRDTQGVHVAEPPALSAAPTPPPAPVEPPPANPAPSTAGSPFSRFTAVEPSKTRRVALIAGAAVVLLIAAGWFAWRLESQVRASAEQLNETQRQLRLTTESAARQINETQVQANRAISEAQELTTRTQLISDVLAAPDLIRFPLVGRDTLESATGQVLWSRSRGILVFTASGLPAPSQDSTYQVWLLTRTGAVSVATFDPDSGGRATVTAMPKVPPLVGAMVTMERKGGSETPSSEPLLTRAPLISSGE
jgi:anti-sigma-K factor RskA